MYIGTMHGLDIWIVVVDDDVLAPDAKLDSAGTTLAICLLPIITWLSLGCSSYSPTTTLMGSIVIPLTCSLLTLKCHTLHGTMH